MGGLLATAVGTATNEADGKRLVKTLMIAEGVSDDANLDDHVQQIYEAVDKFLDNTNFTFNPRSKKY